jgi:hypothetical protein
VIFANRLICILGLPHPKSTAGITAGDFESAWGKPGDSCGSSVTRVLLAFGGIID